MKRAFMTIEQLIEMLNSAEIKNKYAGIYVKDNDGNITEVNASVIDKDGDLILFIN